eukprot:757348-Hanusia_phi.AAC.1
MSTLLGENDPICPERLPPPYYPRGTDYPRVGLPSWHFSSNLTTCPRGMTGSDPHGCQVLGGCRGVWRGTILLVGGGGSPNLVGTPPSPLRWSPKSRSQHTTHQPCPPNVYMCMSAANWWGGRATAIDQ